MTEIAEGIHIVSAHRQDLIDYGHLKGMSVFTKDDFVILVEHEPVESNKDIISDLVANAADEYKKAIDIHRSLEPTPSGTFIWNKMKWKRPRWQR